MCYRQGIYKLIPNFITRPNPEIYLSNNWFCLDLETTNYNKGDAGDIRNRLVYGYGYGPEIGPKHFTDLRNIFDVLSGVDFIVAHGGKFEIKWLIRQGFPAEKILLYDTLLGDYVVAGNRDWSLDLDSVSRRYGYVGKATCVAGLIHSGVCPSEIPSSLLQEYCQQDVEATIHVFNKQRDYLRENGLAAVHYLRCLTTPVLADIELNGLFLDKKLVEKMYNEYLGEYREVAGALQQITGGINLASAPQVASFLYQDLQFEELTDRRGNPKRNKANKAFPEGQPLTDSETVLALKAKTKEQKEFVELRLKEAMLRKKIGTYCELYMDSCGLPFTPIKDTKKDYSHVKGSCKVHGKLNQSIADTHRLTSSGPNLQNMDRGLKQVVTPRSPQWVMLNGDYKTLEMTIAGQLAQDKQCLLDIHDKHDFHSYSASIILKEAWEKAGSSRKTKKGDELRTEAKEETFRPLFGATSGTKRQLDYYKEFALRYADITSMQGGWERSVLRDKKLTVPTGLVFYWPDTEVQHGGYIKNHTQIYNYPIQNFSFEVASAGVVLLWHAMKAQDKKAFLVNFVHDSALLECPHEEIGEVSGLMHRCMTKDIVPLFKQLFNYDINFEINVDVEHHDHWGMRR